MAKRNLSLLQKKYMNFFLDTLDSYKVETPADLSDEKKSEFFDKIKKDWKTEKNESIVTNKDKNIENLVEELVRKQLDKIKK